MVCNIYVGVVDLGEADFDSVVDGSRDVLVAFLKDG